MGYVIKEMDIVRAAMDFQEDIAEMTVIGLNLVRNVGGNVIAMLINFATM